MATIALLSRSGSQSTYDTRIGVNSTSFFAGKFLLGLVLASGLMFPVGRDCMGNEFCGGGLYG